MRSQAAGRERELSTAELVDVAVGAGLAGGEAMLRESGLCAPPSVYMICEEGESPLLGTVTSRRFYRGEDAARAVSAMGVLPGVLGVTRLVVVWENDDLCTALELSEPAEEFATGFVAVEAWRGGHVVRWHPFTPVAGLPGSIGPDWPTVIPDWGPEQRRPGAGLPEPVAALLANWHAQTSDPAETPAVAEAMKSAGYRVCWLTRP